MDDRDLYNTRPRRSRAGLGILLAAVFVAGVALAAYAVHRWDKVALWLHPIAVTQPAAAKPVALVAMPAVPQAAVSPSADPALIQKVESLDQQINSIDARVEQATGNADRAEGLLAAFAARRAIDRGQPLGYVEGLLRQHFGATEPRAVSLVISAAQRPVTLLQLQNGFADLAPSLAGPAPSEGWWSGMRRELGNLLIVRKADTPSSEPTQIAGRAERALEQGQVEAALAEVARMPGSARAAQWIVEARRYVLAHNALDAVEAAALLKPAATTITAAE